MAESKPHINSETTQVQDSGASQLTPDEDFLAQLASYAVVNNASEPSECATSPIVRTPAEHKAFEVGLTNLLNHYSNVGDDQLCEQLACYLDEQMQRVGVGIDRDVALQTFRHLVHDEGRDALAEHVLEWAEERAEGIRWPVAFVYVASGELPGQYRQNTTAVVTVEDRQRALLGHRVINWRDYVHIEDDTDRYTAFDSAIEDCAIALGARSVFVFLCDARLSKSFSVAYDPEQGPSVFDYRTFR